MSTSGTAQTVAAIEIDMRDLLRTKKSESVKRTSGDW
jgi:hypothetical protein